MRVAIVYPNLNLAGSLERYSVLLARSLASAGVEVHCYCNPRTSRADLPGVTLHHVRPLTSSRSRLGYPISSGSFALAATRALRRERARYDIVHVSGIAGWEHDVVTVHAVASAEDRRWPEQGGRAFRAARARARVAPVVAPIGAVRRTIERLQFRPGRYRRVIATTERVRRDLEEVHGVPAELVDVIPYQVELDRLAEAARGTIRRDLGLPAGTPLLLFVGHNFEAKGLFEAIEALAGLEHEAHLVVVGNGTRTPFEEAAARAGLGHRVHFVGRTEAPERYYAEADVLVHPTRGEPWGIPPVEAMAAGVPVVTTEGAGSAEVVRSSRAGLVLADNSPPLLRAAISALLRDPARRREMGERGRAAAARFSPHAHAEAVLATYRQAIDGRPGL